MPITPARMPLFDHLGELRRRVTIVVVSLFVTAIIIYFATPALIEILIDGFSIRFKVAFFFSVIICTPIIIWEIMAFFLPALNAKERKWVVPTVAAMITLFFLGMLFCYFIILNTAIGWMIGQSQEFAGTINEASDYLNIIMMFEIGFGVAFQLPLVIFYLAILHLVPYKDMREQWRYVYVGLMILSAVVTPDASPVTMILMFAALILLYEIALAVARYVIIARDGKAALKWSREDYEQHELDKI